MRDLHWHKGMGTLRAIFYTDESELVKGRGLGKFLLLNNHKSKLLQMPFRGVKVHHKLIANLGSVIYMVLALESQEIHG